MIQVICFSKARPLQLHGYLTSLFAQWSGDFTVSVLFRPETPYQGAYAEVAAEFPQVTWCSESEFGTDLAGLIGDAEFTCFGCDDAVYVDRLDTRGAENILSDDALLGLSLRLGRHITHDMFGAPLPQPKFSEPATIWDFRTGVGDWGYPWEVLGTVYRTELVKSMVASIGAGSPSQVEERGARSWQDHTTLRHMAAYPTARLVVPTVNVVQAEFPNGIVGWRELGPQFLLDCWNHGLRLATDRYQGMTPSSWRVGDFLLRRAA